MNSAEKGLLSIDVNGHLRKLASHSHRSRHHYPVELIRGALRRGATQVTLSISRDKIIIQDNGHGIGPERLAQLTALMDPHCPAAEREEAIQSLYSPTGIGLLSLFSPSPETIVIEDKSNLHSVRVRFKRHLTVEQHPRLPKGSRLEMTRTSPDWEAEIEAVKDYCREVEQTIILNRKKLEKEPVIQHPIASTILNSTKYYKKSQISVTQEGDTCNIWLTDRRIPWAMKTYPPVGGFVFDAVIETERELPDPVFKQLGAAASNLYRWMCKRYDEYPESYRQRIEDLLFKHNRLTGDDTLVNCFSPFTLLGSSYKCNLREIKSLATIKGIPVLQSRYASRYSHLKGHNAEIPVLSPKQIDFLGNHHNLPLRLITPGKKEGKIRQWLARAGRRIKETLRRLHPQRGKVLLPNDLTPSEKRFLSLLDAALSSGSLSNDRVTAFLVDSRGLLPSYQKKNELFIPRHHPLTIEAVKAVNINPANIEIVLPALGIAPLH